MAQAATIPANFSALYEQLKSMLLPDAATIDYQPRSRAELRAGLEETLLPNYQAAVRERQNNTQRTNASIDADAAARGIGSSTWGTDVKNRNYTSEAGDIAGMRGEYNSTLASNLNSLMSEQESRKLSADQYNGSSKANQLANALGLAGANYDAWGASGSGSGSGGSAASSAMNPSMNTLYYNLSSAANQAKKSGVEDYTGQAKNAAAQTLVQSQEQLAKSASASGDKNNPYARWRPKR